MAKSKCACPVIHHIIVGGFLFLFIKTKAPAAGERLIGSEQCYCFRAEIFNSMVYAFVQQHLENNAQIICIAENAGMACNTTKHGRRGVVYISLQ